MSVGKPLCVALVRIVFWFGTLPAFSEISQLSIPVGIKQFFIDFRPQFGGKLTTQLLIDFPTGCAQIIRMFLAHSVNLLTY